MNNLNDDQILEVENKYWADMWIALEQLKQNKQFKKVILEGYFKDKAVNGVSLLAQHAVVSGGHRSSVMEDLIAISSLEDFFVTIENLGATPLESDEDEE
tara:strand:+ start:199 stop:498 length:300 start_codon:yes stop_codon:yes gene_type:complete